MQTSEYLGYDRYEKTRREKMGNVKYQDDPTWLVVACFRHQPDGRPDVTWRTKKDQLCNKDAIHDFL